MLIAIVEDDKNEANALSELIMQYGNDRKLDFKIDTFPNGQAFMNGYRPIYDMIFLDIEMPIMDGLETAKLLRKTDVNTVIIFATYMKQFAISGYEVEATGFIVKPVQYFNLSATLDRAMKFVGRGRNAFIITGTDGQTKRVPCNDLIYVDSQNHNIVYHTVNENIRAYATLSSAEKQLSAPPFNFVRVHRCILVNPKHVRKLTQTSIFVGSNSEELPIVPNKKQELMSKMMDCFGEN